MMTIFTTQFLRFKRNLYIALFWSLFSCTSVLIAAGKDSTEIKPYSLWDDKKFSLLPVAQIGPISISAREFILSYEFGPAFTKKSKDSPRRYLEFMIYEKLLALEGYARGIDSLAEVKMLISDIEGDLATEQLYRNRIWNKVNLSKSEIDLAVSQSQIQLQLKWIFNRNRAEISRQKAMLSNGIAFDSLFNAQFCDTIKYEDRYLETTRFKLEQRNPFLAHIIDTIKIGTPSPIIQTPDGFYIVRVENLWLNSVTTQSEFDRLNYDVNNVLFKSKADSASDLFVNSLMLKENPVIQREAFNILKAYIGWKILPQNKFSEFDLLKHLKDKYPDFNAAGIDKFKEMELVSLNSGKIFLKDFLNWYYTRQPYIKLKTDSHQALFASLQSIVWKMTRDFLLVRLALQEKLNRSNEITAEKKWWLDKLVYSKMKLEIAASVKLDSIKIYNYYDQNKHRYLDDKGIVKQFDEIKDDVKNDLYVYEYSKKLLNKVLGLKERTEIKIDNKLLESLPIDHKSDPKAIEVYPVKTGGTFMRQVYPSIDYEWNFWN